MEDRLSGVVDPEGSAPRHGPRRSGKESDRTFETDGEPAHGVLAAAWGAGLALVETATSDGGRRRDRWGDAWPVDHTREAVVLASSVDWRTRDIQRPNPSRRASHSTLGVPVDRLGRITVASKEDDT